MTIAVVLLRADGADLSWGPEHVSRLNDLGVSHVAMLRDEGSVAVVLEGWAFDPVRSAGEALRILGADGGSGRILLPVVQAALAGSNGRAAGASGPPPHSREVAGP